jgi:anti-anti-sigma regulatory factor
MADDVDRDELEAALRAAAEAVLAGACPDVALLNALAGIALAARRCGCTVRVSAISPDVRALLALAGLEHVLLGTCVSDQGL